MPWYIGTKDQNLRSRISLVNLDPFPGPKTTPVSPPPNVPHVPVQSPSPGADAAAALGPKARKPPRSAALGAGSSAPPRFDAIRFVNQSHGCGPKMLGFLVTLETSQKGFPKNRHAHFASSSNGVFCRCPSVALERLMAIERERGSLAPTYANQRLAIVPAAQGTELPC